MLHQYHSSLTCLINSARFLKPCGWGVKNVQLGKFASPHFVIPTKGGIFLYASYSIDLKRIALNESRESGFTIVQDDILGGVERILATPPCEIVVNSTQQHKVDTLAILVFIVKPPSF
jgi:hypothetical protein